MGYPATYACCPLTDDDQLGSACLEASRCCKSVDGERLCAPADRVCLPGGGLCLVDYPGCGNERFEGQPICAAEAEHCQFN
jgi:hypothetical protein